ncbi:MAG: hypothetical protein OEZ00_05645 [Dehalococcoidia bacterium]|nr:hypothetical protein [Dehalococcoidia bacterium]
MREVSFSIPVSGVVRIDGDLVTITVNRAETTITLGPEVRPGRRISLEPGKTMFDIILETAWEVICRKGLNRFSAPELLAVAREKYPGLKRASFMSRVIACTPDHPSYKHYKSRRDYFSRIGTGLYWLNEQYMADRTSDEERTLSNH